MQLDDFRIAIRAKPFRPFVLHLADGREFAVRHPEMAALAQSKPPMPIGGHRVEADPGDPAIVAGLAQWTGVPSLALRAFMGEHAKLPR